MGDQDEVAREGEDERAEEWDEEGERGDQETGEWDAGTDPDEWIVAGEGADAEAIEADEDGQRVGRYTCGVCGKTFDSAVELHKHLYRVGLVE